MFSEGAPDSRHWRRLSLETCRQFNAKVTQVTKSLRGGPQQHQCGGRVVSVTRFQILVWERMCPEASFGKTGGRFRGGRRNYWPPVKPSLGKVPACACQGAFVLKHLRTDCIPAWISRWGGHVERLVVPGLNLHCAQFYQNRSGARLYHGERGRAEGSKIRVIYIMLQFFTDLLRPSATGLSFCSIFWTASFGFSESGSGLASSLHSDIRHILTPYCKLNVLLTVHHSISV
jgi:hypothetical protein